MGERLLVGLKAASQTSKIEVVLARLKPCPFKDDRLVPWLNGLRFKDDRVATEVEPRRLNPRPLKGNSFLAEGADA